MKITISTEPATWSDFEDKEWTIVDKEHYGRTFDWSKKPFKLTATEKDEIVASLAMSVVVGVATIENIIVTEAYRHHGIGKSLIKKAEEVAKENGVHKISLQTGKTWNTISFYESLGYTVSGELPNHYYHVDFVEMTKFIE